MKKSNESGTDIDLGNRCSQIAYSWAKKTFNCRENMSGQPAEGLEGAFSNVMDFNGIKIGISSDGIGTKIEIAERMNIYDTIGYDLVAMVADDLVANGIEPVNLSNIIDVDFLDATIIDHLMKGLHNACQFAHIVITGGEIAELGRRISGYGPGMHMNWCATGLGILPADTQIIDGSKIKPGDFVISLKSRGFRSNGYSLLRKIMLNTFGDEWHLETYSLDLRWGDILLTPSLIYTPLIVSLIKNGIGINGIAHITGGGICDNLKRILIKKRIGADLDNLFKPLEFMTKIQELGDVSEEQAYLLWNMGNGMLLIADPSDVDRTLTFIEKYGYRARVAGKITSKPEISIQSSGCFPQTLTIRY